MSATCWDDPERCIGCAYCCGGPNITPAEARRQDLAVAGWQPYEQPQPQEVAK